jgi:hypothetical protein
MPGKATTDTVRHIHYLAAALKSPPDHRDHGPAGGPGPRRRLDPRGLPRHSPRAGSICPQRLRRPAAHPRRRVRPSHDHRGLRPRRPTRVAHPDRGPGLQGGPGRSPQHGSARSAGHRQDPPGDHADVITLKGARYRQSGGGIDCLPVAESPPKTHRTYTDNRSPFARRK